VDKTKDIARKSRSGERRAAGAPESEMLSPDEAIVALRALMARIPGVVELTPRERDVLRRSAAMPYSAILASFSVLDASSDVAQVVGQPDEVRQMHDDDGRWETFQTELKNAWKSVSDTNVVRRQRTRLLALQAYRIGQQLARTPGNEGLNLHVKEVMRLRNVGRRRKAAPADAPSEDATTPSGTE